VYSEDVMDLKLLHFRGRRKQSHSLINCCGIAVGFGVDQELKKQGKRDASHSVVAA
jgi:hypothetical protein